MSMSKLSPDFRPRPPEMMIWASVNLDFFMGFLKVTISYTFNRSAFKGSFQKILNL